ncbi:DUF305 domain-containing protein [Micromonospora parathelypteridis]|uniref:Uncharacterized protein (DUF305 family) n=1 Tax=Micromonospora parathelypteridis TaxID=1839617 RepID=A0A840W418_9ACTN|nr:DUF305 domain-containing protein [Micromonospora parathelypteridis]MBB5479858.1 uncharacterized protein (DUF305 family) [Micromonospora parathelypteridis]GGO26209.1 hypothetical protein GCM10011576_49560 [Micromonospora parathelypteridis]
MPRRTRLASLVAALLLTSACAGSPPSSPSAVPQPAPASPAGSAVAGSAVAGSPADVAEMSGIDVVFLSTMVGHSERTLQIVRLARDRVRDDALRTLAAAIEATEADELSAMRGWLPTAGPGASAVVHHHEGHGDEAALDRLRTAPDADVDRTLREVLADHQRAAADLARAQVGVGRNERVRDLARRIEQSRTAEVELLGGTP